MSGLLAGSAAVDSRSGLDAHDRANALAAGFEPAGAFVEYGAGRRHEGRSRTGFQTEWQTLLPDMTAGREGVFTPPSQQVLMEYYGGYWTKTASKE